MREREYEGGTRVGGQLNFGEACDPGVFCRHPLQNAFRILVNLNLRRIKKMRRRSSLEERADEAAVQRAEP